MAAAPFVRASFYGNVNRDVTMPRWRGALAVLCVALLLPSIIATQRIVQERQRDPAPATNTQQARVAESYGKLPLSFEENHGQADPAVRFLAHGRGYSLFLAPTEVVLSLTPATPHRSSDAIPPLRRDEPTTDGAAPPASALRFSFPGANPSPVIATEDTLPGTVNYFMGNDPAQWRTNIGTAAKVRYHELYPGIDLVLYGTQGGQWEYDVIVAPGADPAQFAFAVSGTESTEIDAEGDLVLRTASGEVRQHAPALYQEINGARQPIIGGYALRHDGSIGFQVGEYDHGMPLVIDPMTLAYSTYLGGANNEGARGIAVDGSGNAYIIGSAQAGFPTTPGTYQTTFAGYYDVFVTKLNPSGTALIYSTYLGGVANYSYGNGVAVDGTGSAYVTGSAQAGFPTTPGAYQTTSAGGFFANAFVTKLNPSGTALTYSTYVGGIGGDESYGIAVDSMGEAYMTGRAIRGFPTTPGAYQTIFGGGFYSNSDAFVTKLNVSGAALVYSTYLGGDGGDEGRAIAVDGAGDAYVTGNNSGGGFPTTPGAYQTVYSGYQDAFVTKLNASGTALTYSTYLSRGGNDQSPHGIAVDGAGDAYVTGPATAEFPTTPGAYQAVFGGGYYDVFVTKLNPSGTALIYSTYLGGAGQEGGAGIAVDGAGNAYITGSTSGSFPTTPGAYQAVFGGVADAVVTKISIPAPPPTVASISPNSETQGGGTHVTIAGTGFVSGTTVSFGGVAATNITVGGNGTSLTATTPAHVPGAVNVVVANPDGQSATLTGAYTYLVPAAVPTNRPAPTVLGSATPNAPGRPSPVPLMVMVPGYFGPLTEPGEDSSGCINATTRALNAFDEIRSNHLIPGGYQGTYLAFDYGKGITHCQQGSGWYDRTDNRKAIMQSVDQLDVQLRTFMHDHAAPSRLDLISHSMGGAVALLWVNKYQLDFFIDFKIQVRVMTLDSPIVGCTQGLCLTGSGQGIQDLQDNAGFITCSQQTATTRCNEYQARMLAARGTPSAYIYLDASGTHTVYFTATSSINTRVFSAANRQDIVIVFSDSYPTDLDDTPHNGSHRYEMDYCGGSLDCHGDVLHYTPVASWIVKAFVDTPNPVPTGGGSPPGSGQVSGVLVGRGSVPLPTAKPPTVSTPVPTPVPAPPHR